MVVLERGEPAWTATFATRALGSVRVAMPRIDALERARLRFPRGASFDPPKPPSSGATPIGFPADMPGEAVAIPALVRDFLVVVNDSANVGAAIQ